MSQDHQCLAWRHTTTGLQLSIGADRDVGVPALIGRALHGPDGVGVTDNPAQDLLELEGQWRLTAARQNRAATEVLRAVSSTRAELGAVTARRSLRGRSDRRRLTARGQDLVVDHARSFHVLHGTRHQIQHLRQFVIDLELHGGPLAAAARGWTRNPARPATVPVYAEENIFLFTNPRRAISAAWGGQVIDGEEFGTLWRRDGDDDNPAADQPAMSGPWCLGYIETTGEVYATRRCDYLPPQVWVLAGGVRDGPQVRRRLAALQECMLEPNSLIAAVEGIHTLADPTVQDG